jgi:integrase
MKSALPAVVGSSQFSRVSPENLARLNPAVSALSNFNSPTWDWRDADGPGLRRSINFEIEIDEGIHFSDQRFIAINQALRQLLFAAWVGWINESTIINPRSVVKAFKEVLIFIHFIGLQRKRNSLSELTHGDLEAFLVFLRGREVRYITKMRVVDRICWMWRNQEFIEEKYRPICPCFWQEMPSHRLLGKTPDDEERRQTPMIPDEVLLKLWNVSMDYLENRSKYLLKLLSVRSRIYRAAGRNDESETMRRRRVWKRWSKILNKSIATLNSGKDQPLVRCRGHFRTEINNLQAAAIFILGLVFGGRLSSLISLKPGCIKEIIGPNGQTTIWIKGRLFKIYGEPHGLACQWVVGRFGKLAVEMLEKLGANMRRTYGYSRLIVPTQASCWGDRYGAGVEGNLPRYINKLIFYHNIRTKAGELWHFHPHQLRRTFVCLVARFANCPISVLQGHLGHTANNVTRYYLGKDPGLWIEIVEETEDLAKRRLGDMLAEPMAGAGGEILYAAISKGIEQGKLSRDFRGFAGEHIRLELAEELLNSDARWHFQNLNMCRFRSETALCNPGGDIPKADSCHPLVCKNSYISPSLHGSLWIAIEKVYARSLEKHKRSKILAPELRKKRNEATEIVKRLGLLETPIHA